MRARIWRAHIPKAAAVDDDVDFEQLALKYELSGGFIKNAVLSALSSAVARSHGLSSTLRSLSLSLSLSHTHTHTLTHAQAQLP